MQFIKHSSPNVEQKKSAFASLFINTFALYRTRKLIDDKK